MNEKEWRQEETGGSEDAGRIINIVSHQLKRMISFYTWKDCGLTTMQNRVLHYLLAHIPETPVYQKDIEREFRVSKSTVTEILQLMEKNGFIVRESSRRDGRMKRILPTEKSFAIQMDVRENIRMAEEKLRTGIGDEDFHTCLMVLKQMSENLSREEKEMNLCGHAAQNKEIPQGDTSMAIRPVIRKGREEMYE